MVNYYLKRGERVLGPFSRQKIEELLQTGKLQASAQVAESAQGPWKTISEFKSPVTQTDPNPSETTTAPSSGIVWDTSLAAPPPASVPIPPNNFWTQQASTSKSDRRTTDPTADEVEEPPFLLRCFVPWLGENSQSRYGNLDRYIKIFKIVTRIGFILGLILLVGYFAAVLIFLFRMPSDSFDIKQFLLIGVMLFIFFPIYLGIMHLLYIANMAICDFLRVMMDIESNTRRKG